MCASLNEDGTSGVGLAFEGVFQSGGRQLESMTASGGGQKSVTGSRKGVVCREAGPRQGRQGEQERGRAWQVK